MVGTKPRSADAKAPRKKRAAPKTPAKSAAARSGLGRHHRKDGTLESVGRWEGRTRVGAWVFYHADGRTVKARGRYDRDGRLTGAWTWFGADGAPRQVGRFEGGAQVGLWKRYFGGTEQLCDVGRYEAGKRVGVWKFYDRHGGLRRTERH